MPIYTRTGDKGKTSLFGGKRVLKSDIRVDTYGTLDELNSIIGIVEALLSVELKDIALELQKIQSDLFSIGAYLANPQAEALSNLPERVTDFEMMIDSQAEALPELRNFILPSGGVAGSHLHHARTVCRRAERRLVALMQEEEIDSNVVTYVNRLSDLLFSLARFVNHSERKAEIIWNNT